jgi:hypothetical protein
VDLLQLDTALSKRLAEKSTIVLDTIGRHIAPAKQGDPDLGSCDFIAGRSARDHVRVPSPFLRISNVVDSLKYWKVTHPATFVTQGRSSLSIAMNAFRMRHLVEIHGKPELFNKLLDYSRLWENHWHSTQGVGCYPLFAHAPNWARTGLSL